MAETRRLLTDVLSRIPDNTTGLVSPEDVRDAVVSTFFDAENVFNHGAVGDGIADDITALQAAMDAASTGSGIMILPAGTYKISVALILKNDVIIRGAGISLTTIKGDNIAGPVVSTNAVQVSRCWLEDIAIDNTLKTTTGGLGLELFKFTSGGCRNVEVRNVELGFRLRGPVSKFNNFYNLRVNNCSQNIVIRGDCQWTTFFGGASEGAAIAVEVDTTLATINIINFFGFELDSTSKGIHIHGANALFNLLYTGGRMNDIGASTSAVHIDTGPHVGIAINHNSMNGYPLIVIDDSDDPTQNIRIQNGTIDFGDGKSIASHADAFTVECKASQWRITGGATDNPRVTLYQLGTIRGRFEYLDAGDIVNIRAEVGSLLTFTSNGVEAFRIDTSGQSIVKGPLKTEQNRRTLVTDITASGTLSNTLNDTLFIDTTSGAITMTLPAAPITGSIYEFKKINTGANAITLDGNGKNIEGSAGDHVFGVSVRSYRAIKYDGTEWWIMSRDGV